jgi:hypothetical protein
MTWSALLDILKESLLITAIVTALMLLIEYLSYRTEGKIVTLLRRSKVGGVVAAAILGVIPGCVGGYITVSMYSRRVFSFSALLAMMIASTGDEAFVMLAMYPVTALWIFLGLFALAIVVGLLGELFERRRSSDSSRPCGQFGDGPSANPAHESAGTVSSHNEGKDLRHRMLHTLGEALKIFAWAFGVLLVVQLASNYVDLETWISDNAALMVPLAVLIGLIPQSGPHMVFVTMFAQGLVPLPVLLANCLMQDGHAGLPLLAEDKRSFFRAKGIKCVMALAAGYLLMLF